MNDEQRWAKEAKKEFIGWTITAASMLLVTAFCVFLLIAFYPTLSIVKIIVCIITIVLLISYFPTAFREVLKSFLAMTRY